MWNQRFLELAQRIAAWSKDPSTKVGAVIADKHNRIVSIGFNGFPRGVDDNHRLDDRTTKYEMIVHAEVNAILFANQSLEGCKLYVYPLPPCSRCAALVIQAGIKEVYSPEPTERWAENCALAKQMFEEAGVKVVELFL